MKFVLFDGGEDGKRSGVGFMEISAIFATQGDFLKAIPFDVSNS